MAFDTDQRHWMPQHLDLDITSRCNLRCKYCYLGSVPEHKVGVMGGYVCDQVLEYTRRLAQHYEPLQGENKIHWNFFGGEPFCSFQVIRYLVAKACEHRLPVFCTVFTNGATATQEQVAWCLSQGIVPKRSVGGCPEACAITRPGNYLERYEQETAWWNDWGTMRRVTVVPETARYIMDSLRYFHNRGYWGGLDFVTDDYTDWPDEALETLKEQLTRLAREFVRQYRAGHVMANERLQVTGQWLFQQPPMLNLGCGACWGTQGITWDGSVVACHRALREPPNSPLNGGTLSDVLAGKGPTFGPTLVDKIARYSQAREPFECVECPARLPCQHGCYHLSCHTTGDFDRTPRVRCEVNRHYVKLARWIHGEIAGIDPFWYAAKAEPCLPIAEDA